MKNYLPLIIGMMAVTYLPRLLPLLIMTERPINPKLKRFLCYIPYTALSALITQGIISATSALKLATVISLAVAGLCSWFKGGLVLSVLVSILAAFLILQIF